MTKLVHLEDVEAMINKMITEGKFFWHEYNYRKLIEANELLSSLKSLPTQESIQKKLALDFAYWYHNGLSNRERGDVEEELKNM